MRFHRRSFLALSTASLVSAFADDKPSKSDAFASVDDGKCIHVSERGEPVFTYRYAQVLPAEGIAEKFRRANYLHPVHSPAGEVVTEDFPADHYHHRGVFWAWPNCAIRGRKLNVWELDGARSVFKEWIAIEARRKQFRAETRSVWQFDEDGFAPIEERVEIVVLPARNGQRAIDFKLAFANTADAEVTFQGSPASAGSAGPGAKGYGGICFRPDATRKPFAFTGIEGHIAEDRMACETPWVDVSWTSDSTQGVAILQHPENPGFPHPGWMIRHYGFLGASWPHTSAHTLKPGESFTLRYRLLLHEGDAESAGIAAAARSFAKGK
ncbi:MAG TPA: PmoA family protein [Candidatus Hydrogenedentes bacterium]|nr:PmoA family protein [Candidatus Hydrogenedentota bacterium]